MRINWQAADVHEATVAGAILRALADRGHRAEWLEAVGRTLYDENMWSDVLGPLLDSLEQGQYHRAGPSPFSNVPPDGFAEDH